MHRQYNRRVICRIQFINKIKVVNPCTPNKSGRISLPSFTTFLLGSDGTAQPTSRQRRIPQCMCMCMSSSRPYRQAQQTDDGSDRISTPCLARVDLDHPCSNHGHGRRTAEHQACHPDPTTTTSRLHTSAPTVSHSWQFGEEGSPILSLKNAVPCK
jgi:hypothetical protein